MKTLIVGAGATGGYLASQLRDAGRDVTVLVRDGARRRLDEHGLRVREPDGSTSATPIRAITRDDLDSPFDVVVVAVRSDAVAASVADFTPAVGAHTRIVALVNGLDHLDVLLHAFDAQRVVGATARMATSLTDDGVITVVSPGIALQLGALDGASPKSLAPLATELTVDGVDVDVLGDIKRAMWDKFMFIAATATLTCLARDVVGAVITAPGGGRVLAERILREVNAVAVEDTGGAVALAPALRTALTDPASKFGPSMFRDLIAGRPVEVSVLRELSWRAKCHHLDTPLLDAAVVAVEVHNRRIGHGASG